MAGEQARDVLLRVLGHLDEARDDVGKAGGPEDWEPEHLVVCWAGSYQVEGEPGTFTLRGWDNTSGPGFVTTGLLREVAAKIEHEAVSD